MHIMMVRIHLAIGIPVSPTSVKGIEHLAIQPKSLDRALFLYIFTTHYKNLLVK